MTVITDVSKLYRILLWSAGFLSYDFRGGVACDYVALGLIDKGFRFRTFRMRQYTCRSAHTPSKASAFCGQIAALMDVCFLTTSTRL